MINVQVQFERAGEVFTYSAPESIDVGDRVLIGTSGEAPERVATVIAIGSHHDGPADPIVRVIGPMESAVDDDDG